MKLLTPFFIILSLFLILSCKSNTIFVPSESKDNFIVLGNGGGFTGKTTTYYILDDGAVYREMELQNNFSYLGKIDKTIVRQQWDTFDNLNLKDVKINNPGNMYFFMDFKTNDHSNKMMWGGGEKTQNNIVETIYLILNNQIKTLDQ